MKRTRRSIAAILTALALGGASCQGWPDGFLGAGSSNKLTSGPVHVKSGGAEGAFIYVDGSGNTALVAAKATDDGLRYALKARGPSPVLICTMNQLVTQGSFTATLVSQTADGGNTVFAGLDAEGCNTLAEGATATADINLRAMGLDPTQGFRLIFDDANPDRATIFRD